jgi:murein DD-endopeptidase MepM/ murein hydrolase activator NlpD
MPKMPKMRTIMIVLGLMIWAIVLASSTAAQISPTQIAVSPTEPELGDTLSVTFTGKPTTPPSIAYAGQTYAMYPIGADRYRALVPTTPLDKPGSISLQVNAGADSRTIPLTLQNRDFPTQSIWLPAGQDGNVSDAEYDRVDAFKRIVTPEKLWQGRFLRPNSGEITSTYGIRRYYNGEFAQDYYHRGVDYAGGTGSAILAPAAGRVEVIGAEKDGFKVHGNWIGLNHGQGVESIFIHLNSIAVKPGDVVQAGQSIGTLGSTGAATGPHLHWGLYVNGKSVNPGPWRETGFE